MRGKIFFKYLFIALVVLINSCKDDSLGTVEKPKNLISRNGMALILADMHLADAGLQAMSLSPDSLKRSSAGYDVFIFEKHETTEKDFETSFDYYLSKPNEMDSVYQEVIELLSEQEAKSRGILLTPENKQ
jgi:hypothetical protein